MADGEARPPFSFSYTKTQKITPAGKARRGLLLFTGKSQRS